MVIESAFYKLAIFVFLWGAAVSTYQVILLREYMCLCGGNEISIGLFLSVWLLFNALGAFIMGLKRANNIRLREDFLSLSGFISIVLSLLFLRYFKVLSGVEAGQVLDISKITISSVASLILPASLSGLSFPYLSNLLKTYKGSLSISYVYGFESLGLMFGYLISIIMLGFQFSHLFIVAIIGGLPLIYVVGKGLRDRKKLGVLCLYVVFLVFLSALDGITLKDSFERENLGYRFVKSTETNYNRYIIARRNSQDVLFVNNMFAKVIGDEYNSKFVAHLIMSLAIRKDRVLIIGEASYDILNHILEYNSVVDYVEYDSSLFPFLKDYINLSEFKNLNKITDDGRGFVKRIKSNRKYDLVFVDLPEPLNLQMNRYYSLEFFREVRFILSEKGIFIFSLPSISSIPSKTKRDYLVSIFNALKGSFESVDVIGYDETIFVASLSPIELTFEKVLERFKNGLMSQCDFEPEILSLALQEENNRRLMEIIGNGTKDMNSDLLPRGMLSALTLWEMSVAVGRDSILSKFSEWGLIFFILFVVLNFILTFIYKNRKFIYTSVIIFWQGFLSMALELMIMYRFQLERGTLYLYSAFLFAIFMIGISTGSFLTGFMKLRHHIILMIDLGVILLLYIHPLPVWTIFFLLLIIGIATGLLFGRLSHYSVECERNLLIVSASVLDYSDCLGGMLASLCTSVILLPSMGFTNSLVFFSFIVCFLIFLSYRYGKNVRG